MEFREKGTGIILKGKDFIVGDRVCANDRSSFKGLIGEIKEIKMYSDSVIYINVEHKGDIITIDPSRLTPIKYLY